MKQGLRQEIILGLIAALFAMLTPLSSFGYTVNYTYDDAYRLTQVALDTGYGETYTYDEVGNRLTSEVTFTPDTTPDPFVFASISNVALNTVIESSPIAVTGINTSTAVSITSGEYSVSTDSGATWSPYSSTTPAAIAPNSTVKVRQMSAGTSVTTTDATLFIGGVSATFSVTTIDSTPPTSIIRTPEDGTGIMNTSFTISGTASDIGSSVSKVEISINSGPWTEATGTSNWTYQWTNITPGTYTIQSRATDTAGNVEIPGTGITVHVYAYTPSTISISGRSLVVNSQSFTIRGINYSPVPIGQDPYNPPYGDYFTSAYSAIHTRDLTQIRQMGANSIRLWIWDTEADHKDFLDLAYNSGTSPIYVIAGYNINPGLDLSSQTIRGMIKEDFRAMVQTHKDHPAILIWAIGNDLNAAGNYSTSLGSLFSLINEMAGEAHALDPYHPVMMPLADETLIETITAYNASVPALDIWSANVYRGNSFGSLFSTYQAASSKPLLITGYGIDAYNDTTMAEDQTAQADYAAALWNEIVANSATSIGGLLTEYSDQWWAGMLSTDTGCPEANNPAVHGDCGRQAVPLPDGYDNYEWWGVMRPADNGTGPDSIEKRSVFNRLQNIWCSEINQPGITVTTPNGGESYQAGTTQTLQWTYTGDPGASVKIELFKGGVFNSTIAASVSTGTLCSGTYAWTIPLSQTTGTDYRIRITSTSNSAYMDESEANFTIVPPPCTINAPSASITPSNQTITSNAGSVSYTVSITNNDSGAGCSSTTFSLLVSNTNSTDFIVATGLTPVTLAPGGSTIVSLPVTAVSGKTTGMTNTSVTATAAGHGSGVSNSVSTTLTVAPQVAVLDDWTNIYSAAPNNTSASNLSSGSFSVGSGANRLFLVTVVLESSTPANRTISATYGGIALTQIRVTASTQREIVWMGYLKESQIGTGSKALAISYSGIPGSVVNALHVKWASYTGVNQTTPIAGSGATNTASTSATFGSAINYVNNGMTVVVSGNGGTPATGTLTAAPSFTAGAATTTDAQTSRTFTTAKHTAAGSYAGSTSVAWTGTTSAWSGLVVVSLQP